MKKKSDKERLFEQMHKVTGMPLIESNEFSSLQDPSTPLEKMDYPEFKNQVKKHVDADDYNQFHYLIGAAYNGRRHDLVSQLFFDFDGDYRLSKHFFNELVKSKDSGFWTNHMMEDYDPKENKRWNDVSVWTTPQTEEDMRNAGFEFDQKGNCDLFYNGEKVGFYSNFNGVMLDDEYVDELIPMFQKFRGTGVWNYNNWRKEAEERKKHYTGSGFSFEE